MDSHRPGARALLHDVLLGTAVGLVVLGVGGRLVMRAVVPADAPTLLTVGGTVTVIAAGAAAGAAGAVIHAVAGGVARLAGGRAWVRLALFGALLALVTARGLRGSPPEQAVAFWPLVAAYGALLAWMLARRRAQRAAAHDGRWRTVVGVVGGVRSSRGTRPS